ncbi:MAG TPA: molybdopterin-binding protein [Candidatus Binatia bacterium]|nr:molybdopterin-binding protein [Candidatus Binatia bacterium]
MKAVALSRPGTTAAALLGRIACHDVRDAAGKIVLRKGQGIDDALARAALGAPWDTIHVLELEPGDLHEEAAGGRLSQAAAGEGVDVKGYTGGQWTLASVRRGLLRVHDAALLETNRAAGISVFTLYDLQPVEAGETVAKAKVTPLAIGEATVKRVEAAAWGAGGLVAVQPFSPRVLGALTRETLEPRQRQRFDTALREKIDWFGSRLLPVRYSGGDASAVAAELRALLGEGAQLLIVAGASALDPLDPVFLGVGLLGGHMERHGVPAHPGSLLFLAHVEGVPVIGMPTCGMFSQATTFDLVLPRLLAGEEIGNDELAALGHGGLLSQDSAWRFPRYRESAARGELPG